MKTLKISDDLTLPLDAVTQTFAILAKRRVGKTYTASVIAEEMARAGLPFVVLDPTGAWWGLRSSADGKSEGLPVVIVGGLHGDLPLDAASGKVIAELVVEHPGFYVIDLSDTESNDAQDRFATDFARRLYRLKDKHRDPLHLFIDEADAFAPQQPTPGQRTMLGAFEDLVRRGGIRGLGMTLITQRPAVLNKNVLTQVEVIIALQTTSPQDQDAVKDWVKRNGDKSQLEEVSATLASLKTGEAWFYSPSWLEEFRLIQVRARETFNSSATPRVGERRVTPAKLAPVDLEELKEKIADSIEKAKANDPEELKRQVAELKREAEKLKKDLPRVVAEAATRVERIEVPVITDAQIARVERCVANLEALRVYAEEMRAALQATDEIREFMLEGVRRLGMAKDTAAHPPISNFAPKAPRAVPQPAPSGRAAQPAPVADGDVTRPMQRILDTLQSFRLLGLEPVSKSNVAVFSDQSPTSSGYANNLGRLRMLGLIEYLAGGQVALTGAGLACAGDSAPIASLDELHRAWFAKLSSPKVKILRALIDRHPSAISKATLAELSEQSATSSGYANNLGSLRSLGLIDYPQPGSVRATGLLFPEGLS
jgi:hypothetical protein